MGTYASWMWVLVLALPSAVLGASDVVVEKRKPIVCNNEVIHSYTFGWTIRTPNYQAYVDQRAVLCSLVVNGVEFMAPTVRFARYGHALKGAVRFEGSPYTWQKPAVVACWANGWRSDAELAQQGVAVSDSVEGELGCDLN